MLKLPDCPPVAIGVQLPPLEVLLEELDELDDDEELPDKRVHMPELQE